MYTIHSIGQDLYFPNIRIMMTDLYETDAAIYEVASYYKKKIIHWFKSGDFDDILKYFIKKDGKISVVDTKKDVSQTTADRHDKIKFITERFLTRDGMIKLVEQVKYKTGLGAYDFTRNNKYVKTVIKHIFKAQIRKHM